MSYTYDITMFKDTFEHEFTWLNGFMRNVRRFGYKTAMVDPQKEQTWTYEELNRDANRLANALKASGVKKNDTILYLLPNSPQFALSYIAQFYPVHTYNQTNIEVKILDKNYVFTATGKTILDIGWRKLYSSDDNNKENLIPNCKEGDNLIYLASNITENITKPPKRFTTSTLLEAMKNINKYVVNPKYKNLLKTTCGIGTEATRAGIIDKLIDKGFLELNKNNLYPTKISIYLNNILPKEIKEPDLTAIWEDWLTQINEGTLDVNKFNHNQIALIKNAIDFTKTLKIKSFNESSYSCPYCNSSLRLITLKDKSKVWICLNKDNCKKGFFSNLNNKPVLISCPNCKTGYLKKRKGSKGYFWSCDNYPTCKTTFSDKNGKPAIK